MIAPTRALSSDHPELDTGETPLDTVVDMPARTTDATVRWLLDGDPAIRWQALRDLTGAAEGTVERERRKVARQGWGARLLAKQDADGRWASGKSLIAGLYNPKWISTTYTLMLLRDMGLPAGNRQVLKACGLLLDRGIQSDGGVSYGWSASEPCVTGMVLSLVSYFECEDPRVDSLSAHLLDQQMEDGGWNCRRLRGGASHASVHTTISVLEGLRWYELARRGKVRAVRSSQRKAREFLLRHRLFRSHRTGRVIQPIFTRFSFPPRWHYDVLRALDYLQWVSAPRDERLKDAIDLVRDRRSADGRWRLDNTYPGKTYFDMERAGRPSRWNTLRALRVLQWWDGQ